MQSSVYACFRMVSLCLCWYIISSFASQVTKKILTLHPLPLFLGEFQFAYTALLACVCCVLSNRFPSFCKWFPEGTVPQYHDENHPRYQRRILTQRTKQIFLTVLPLSLFQVVGKYFGHTATSQAPISTVASIKTLSPVCIILIQKCFDVVNLPLGGQVYTSLTCIILGVWILVAEDTRDYSKVGSVDSATDSVEYSSYGILCAVSSMVVFAAQNVYGKGVFTYKQENFDRFDKAVSHLPVYADRKESSSVPKGIKYDKLTLMIYISLVGFSLSFGWFMTWEFPTVYSEIKQLGLSSIPWNLFFLNGTFHFLQAMIAYHLLGEVSTLTYSIVSIMKRIVVITVSWVVSGRQITRNQLLGLLLNVFGLFLYERCNSKSRKGHKKAHAKNKPLKGMNIVV